MDAEQKVEKLENIIGYLQIHVKEERWLVSKLTTEEKELWADACESWRNRIADWHEDDPWLYDRWWQE